MASCSYPKRSGHPQAGLVRETRKRYKQRKMGMGIATTSLIPMKGLPNNEFSICSGQPLTPRILYKRDVWVVGVLTSPPEQHPKPPCAVLTGDPGILESSHHIFLVRLAGHGRELWGHKDPRHLCWWIPYAMCKPAERCRAILGAESYILMSKMGSEVWSLVA